MTFSTSVYYLDVDSGLMTLERPWECAQMKHHSFAASEKQDARVKFLEDEDFAHVTADHVVLAAAPVLLGVALRESGLVVVAMPEFQIHTAEHVPSG